MSEMAAEYPPERPGETFRFLPYPCAAPEGCPGDDTLTAADSKGDPYPLRGSLGLPPLGSGSREDRVRWTAV